MPTQLYSHDNKGKMVDHNSQCMHYTKNGNINDLDIQRYDVQANQEFTQKNQN